MRKSSTVKETYSSTFIYDQTGTNFLTALLSRAQVACARYGHGCIFIKARVNGREVLFFTGGYYENFLNIWIFHSQNMDGMIVWKSWFLSSLFAQTLLQVHTAYLEYGLAQHKMVKSFNDNSVSIVGGGTFVESLGIIFEMKCPDNTPASCYFEKIETKLKYPRWGQIALSITTELAKELCQ